MLIIRPVFKENKFAGKARNVLQQPAAAFFLASGETGKQNSPNKRKLKMLLMFHK
jgi:hypothetical protein